MRIGPTRKILMYARSQPGGVIRWHEAASLYRSISGHPRDNSHYHMNLGRIFRRYFTRVDGARGFYVLNECMVGED